MSAPRIRPSGYTPPSDPGAVARAPLTSQQVLAIGFLLVILSCALFHKYHPLMVVATFVLAPLPNFICGRCANPDDFVESGSSALVDFGRFCTGFLVVMGIGKWKLLPPRALDLESCV